MVAAQERQPVRDGAHSERPRAVQPLALRELVERAMGSVCADRKSDPMGSVPIDEMQSRPSLPVSHPSAIAGARRAERLLPLVRTLTIEAIRQLADEYEIDDRRVRAASARIEAVTFIKPDPDLRDNASVTMSDPRTIHFGTIFLAGLRSDEGMVSVIAHELTHFADGREDALRLLFRQVGRRSSLLTGMRLTGRRPEELTCDLVGTMVARSFIERTPSVESLSRRLSRAIEHNCVEEDDTDEDHLSPRNTLRALLALDQTLAHDLMGADDLTLFRDEMRSAQPSLTTPFAAPYHPQF